jgi:hypothetical protein
MSIVDSEDQYTWIGIPIEGLVSLRTLFRLPGKRTVLLLWLLWLLGFISASSRPILYISSPQSILPQPNPCKPKSTLVRSVSRAVCRVYHAWSVMLWLMHRRDVECKLEDSYRSSFPSDRPKTNSPHHNAEMPPRPNACYSYNSSPLI